MRNRLPTVAIAAVLMSAAVACACNIPVFRYALERWRPDQCEIVVFHDGPLSPSHQAQLDRVSLNGQGQQREYVKVTLANIKQESSTQIDLWSAIESTPKSLPYAVVRTTLGPGKIVNGWHGPLHLIESAGIVDSPARDELSRRLLAGHAIVWLMISSEDESRNLHARTMLKHNFQLLEDKVELPEGIGLPGSELHSEIPLLLRFSLLEIDRSDTKESFLVKLLSGFHPEAFADGEPLIIPVFGRGRALEVIPADEFTPRLMEDLTLFLSGACSCQVKEQNPGFDLLLAVDWNKELFGEGGSPPPARTTRDRQNPILLTIPPGQ